MKIASDSLENIYLTAADFSETGRKIKSFARLPKGWHFGEGCPPSRDLIERATELENLALDLGFSVTDAFPGPNGEVRHCVYSDDHYYEFTLELDGSVTTVIEDADVESEMTSSFEGAKKALERVSVWNTSDLFTGNIGTSRRRTSKDLLFKTPPRITQFQLLTENARLNETNVIFACGSMNFTPDIHHVLQSGFSTTNFYQTEQSSPTNQAILETNVIETCAA